MPTATNSIAHIIFIDQTIISNDPLVLPVV